MHILATKYVYGYSNYSFPFSPNIIKGRIWSSTPNRGDIIVFRPPHDPDTNWIKRVVGLPGDRIQMIEGILFINGDPVLMKHIGPYDWKDPSGRQYDSQLYTETLPSGVEYKIIKTAPFGKGFKDNTREYIVPSGSYFLMGDNRDYSDDSRFSLGFVPHKYLVGRVDIIYF